jgi:hypothetical protein
LLQIPGKVEDVAGSLACQSFGSVNRSVCAWRKSAVPIWVSIDGVLEEIGLARRMKDCEQVLKYHECGQAVATRYHRS